MLKLCHPYIVKLHKLTQKMKCMQVYTFIKLSIIFNWFIGRINIKINTTNFVQLIRL